MDLFNWGMLGSYAGSVFAVGVLTQITKGIPGIKALPTQLWSYALALATLLLAMGFGPGFTAQGTILAFFNAALVSLSANGGFQAVTRLKSGLISSAAKEA